MSERVSDASLAIAILRGESFDAEFADAVSGAIISTVNYSELMSKAAEFGLIGSPALNELVKSFARIEPFTRAQADLAAKLRLQTRAFGLSLGDRACLALAIELDADVYTADRAWAGLQLGCRIHLIR